MSRYKSNNGWFVLAAIAAVIAWFIFQNDDKETDLERQLQTLADEVGEGMASIYAFIADQMNPAVHADPAPSSCVGGTCPTDEFELNLSGSFTDTDTPTEPWSYEPAYQPVGGGGGGGGGRLLIR